MSANALTPWMVEAVIVGTWAGLLMWWLRHELGHTCEQSILRHRRWSAHGPVALVTLVTYVMTSSVVIAIGACCLAQGTLTTIWRNPDRTAHGPSEAQSEW